METYDNTDNEDADVHHATVTIMPTPVRDTKIKDRLDATSSNVSLNSIASEHVEIEETITSAASLLNDASRVITCHTCNDEIVGPVITALNRTYHKEHFICAHCGQELGTRNFYERDGLPYCEKDYHQLFSPKCASCGNTILDVSKQQVIFN